MKEYDKAFNDQIDFLMDEYRSGHIKSIPELMKLINMIYGDYMEFHPKELPEARRIGNNSDAGNKPSSQVDGKSRGK